MPQIPGAVATRTLMVLKRARAEAALQ